MNNLVEYAGSNLINVGFKKLRENVFLSTTRQVFSNVQIIDELKKIAKAHHSKRARICFHNKLSDTVQEMLIVFAKDIEMGFIKQRTAATLTYVVLEGQAELNQMKTDNITLDTIYLGSKNKQMSVCKIEADIFRQINVISDFFVFYEIAQGPFEDSDTIYLDHS